MKTPRIIVLSLAVLGLAALASSSVEAAAYMKLGSIKGEAVDKSHKGWADLASFSMGTTRWREGMPAPGSSEPRGSGGRGQLTVSKRYDKASPYILKACAEGTHFPEVKIHLCSSGESCESYMEYTMHDVIVSSYSMSGGGDVPVEEVAFNYAKVAWTYAETGDAKPKDMPAKRRQPAKPNMRLRTDEDG